MYSDATIRIDLSSPTPAYRQIVDQLRTHLVDGLLKPGQELPSVRRLATDLGVHFNTVAEAYRTLAEEGWIEVAHGKGARVVEREQPARADKLVEQQFRQRLRQLVSEMRAQGLSPARIARELTALAEGMKS